VEDFEIGDYVKVETDRSHEIGVVCNIRVMSSNSAPFFSETGRENFRKIVSRATVAEKRLFLVKIRDEDRALHICNELVARKRLPIVVLDATFQVDRTKLTFSYVSHRYPSHPIFTLL
jgi:cell fate regulator YaaT (PSP1 superfamily)